MEIDNAYLEQINKNALEILHYFIKSLIYNGSQADIKAFLTKLQESLKNFKDRRSFYSFQRFLPSRRYQEEIRFKITEFQILLSNFRKFFTEYGNNLKITNNQDLNKFFENLNNRIDAFSKSVMNSINAFCELERDNEDFKLRTGSIFKTCLYWYMNSILIPRFTRIEYNDYIKSKELKQLLQYAFILFFRFYEQSNLNFTSLNAIELDLEIDFLIQDINNMLRFAKPIK